MNTELGKTPEGLRFGLVGYLDLLGAREFFSTADADELRSVLEFAGNYVKSASEALGMPSLPFEIPRQFVAFQDTLVRCAEIGWTSEPESLPRAQRGPLLARWILTILDEIASVRDIQLNFVCKRGLLLRGAVALGVYDVTEGRIHGPAFMNALNGESKWAKYPRILIDSNIITFSLTSNPRHDWIQANTAIDTDSYHYIDYLHGAAREVPWDASYFVEYALDHRLLIEAMLRGERLVPPDKLQWLRAYHNQTIHRIANYISSRSHIDPTDLLVAEESAKTEIPPDEAIT
jgi:hypothetical protein